MRNSSRLPMVRSKGYSVYFGAVPYPSDARRSEGHDRVDPYFVRTISLKTSSFTGLAG